MALSSLAAGVIDVFPEYSGTLSRTVLELPELVNYADIVARMAELGYAVSPSLGFNNTYAIGMQRARATALGIKTISGLKAHPELRGAFTPEFTSGDFGWPGLRARYALPQTDVRSMDHRVAYEAVASGAVDMTDAYTTDAAVAHLDLVTLTDDLAFFDRYEGLALAKSSFITKAPQAWAALVALGGALDETRMMALNKRIEVDGADAHAVASAFLATRSSAQTATAKDAATQATTVSPTLAARVLQLSVQHLVLVLASTAVAVLIGLPLGVLAARRRRARVLILQVAGVLQTVPSVALLCLLIPLLGIGWLPAFVAMVLYGLFPIVRSVVTGISSIEPALVDAMMLLAVPPRQRLWRLELPLARAHIHNGVTVCVVTAVGTATLAALIGGGGLGALLIEGLALFNTKLIVAGAVPAAALAFGLQALMDALAPRHHADVGAKLSPGN